MNNSRFREKKCEESEIGVADGGSSHETIVPANRSFSNVVSPVYVTDYKCKPSVVYEY